MEIGAIDSLDEIETRKKIRELAIENGIQGYGLAALWTLINHLVKITAKTGSTEEKKT